MEIDPFKEYLKESEPDKKKKVYAWRTAIGLQDVDGLKPSQYLIETATQNIEGYITIEEALDRIDTYYEEKEVHSPASERTEEADKVASRIAQFLSETAFPLRHRSIFLFIENYFKEFIRMQVRLESIILLKKNGY